MADDEFLDLKTRAYNFIADIFLMNNPTHEEERLAEYLMFGDEEIKSYEGAFQELKQILLPRINNDQTYFNEIFRQSILYFQMDDAGINPELFIGGGKLRPLSMADVEVKEAEWLIDGYVPKKGITIVGGNGGVGKSSVICSIAASISNRKATFLESDDETRNVRVGNGRVLIFSAEDSESTVIKPRLIAHNANLNNIYCLTPNSKNFEYAKFKSPELRRLLNSLRPDLIIFDPIQSFLSRGTKMSERSAMRSELFPLIEMMEEFGFTTIIIMHTNKNKDASGRDRFADSSDIFDISRSALLIGNTGEDDTKYISLEKTNYGKPMPSVIFRINDKGVIEFVRYDDRKDVDFVYLARRNAASGKKAGNSGIEQAIQFIIEILSNNGNPTEMPIADIDKRLSQAGYSDYHIRNAKKSLKKTGKIIASPGGKGAPWVMRLADKSNTGQPEDRKAQE